MPKTPAKLSVRDRIAARKRVTVSHDILIGDPDAEAVARAAYERARQANEQSQIFDAGNTSALKSAAAKEKAALAKLQDFYITLHFAGLTEHDFEALVNEHPPTDEQRSKTDEQGNAPMWNYDTFIPALVDACLVDDTDITVEDWQTWLGPGPEAWERGAKNALVSKLIGMQSQDLTPGIPKG